MTTRRSSNKRAVNGEVELKRRVAGVCVGVGGVDGLCVVSTDGGGVLGCVGEWVMGGGDYSD